MQAVILPLLALAGCGGGGGSGFVPPQPPQELRTGLLYGYYGDCDTCLEEQAGHVNLAWVMGWGKRAAWLDNVAAHLTEAKQRGIPNAVLGISPAYGDNPERDVRYVLDSLRVQGLLDGIVALYPVDEPDVNGIPAEKIVATNAMLRRVMADYPEFAHTKLAVIYGPRSDYRGIESYDWVGFDDYDQGAAVLELPLAHLKAKLRPDQQVILVPGGASPWRQDPQPFFNVAESDARVVALVPFIWFDNAAPGVGLGIRSNGLRAVYCAAGKRVVTAANDATCDTTTGAGNG
jgi:hypothetical protein